MAELKLEGIPPEQQPLQMETKMCCAKLDSLSLLDSGKEGIPPDLQRLNDEIAAMERQLRVAKAQRAVAIAKADLKIAQEELQAALTYSLNPSAPTDCKAVHEDAKKMQPQWLTDAARPCETPLNPFAPTDCKAVQGDAIKTQPQGLKVAATMAEPEQEAETDDVPTQCLAFRYRLSRRFAARFDIFHAWAEQAVCGTASVPVDLNHILEPGGDLESEVGSTESLIASYEALDAAKMETPPEQAGLEHMLEPDVDLEPEHMFARVRPEHLPEHTLKDGGSSAMPNSVPRCRWADVAVSSDESQDDDTDLHSHDDMESDAEKLTDELQAALTYSLKPQATAGSEALHDKETPPEQAGLEHKLEPNVDHEPEHMPTNDGDTVQREPRTLAEALAFMAYLEQLIEDNPQHEDARNLHGQIGLAVNEYTARVAAQDAPS